ncbi:MAG: hypothetical protein C3F11_09465, partial [Methylocystaceae bacterium]
VLARLSERATTRNASNLERYLIERIEKGAVDTWLDRLELHAVAKLCETIGAVARHGRDVVASELSPSQWWEAGGAGFDIASQGEPGMFSFLSGLQQSYPRASGANEGPKATFGYFYEWLQGVEDPAYDEIKDLVARHAMATTPVGPGDFVFGRPIVRRIWHSVRTASLEYDAHPKRLRKLLALGGVIPEDHRGQTDNAVLFDAERHRETLERISTSMSLREVETYLGAGRVHAQLLYDHGFIKPFVSGEVEGISAHAFAREDLDDFMCRLEAGATQIDRCAPPIYPIADAARRANRSAAEIVAAIVDDKLQWKGKLRGAVGFASIVVDLNEIKELLKDPTPDAQALYLVARRLGTSQHVVRAAIENGILSSTVVKNPRNRCPTKAIPNSEVERFQKQFISLFEIARAYGVHHLNMRKTLSEKGIHPAFDVPLKNP